MVFDDMFSQASELIADSHGEPATYTAPDGAVTALTNAIWCGWNTSDKEEHDGRSEDSRQMIKVLQSELPTCERYATIRRPGEEVWTVEAVDCPPGGWWLIHATRSTSIEHVRPGHYLR